MVNTGSDASLLSALRSFLQEVLPQDWRWQLRARQGRSDADALLELTDPRGEAIPVQVELKKRLWPAEIVRQIGWYDQRGPWLLVAPRVGERGRQLLTNSGISWIELETGECRIVFGTLRIDRLPARRGSVRITGGGTIKVAGSAAEEGPRFVADLFSGKALRIVRWLLIDRERSWTIEEMVAAARASQGFVSRTFATLERDAYMERDRGDSRLRDAAALIAAWAATPAPPDRVLSRVSLLATPQAILDAVRQASPNRRYAVTAEAAAEQVAPFARFSRVEMYVDESGPWDRLMELTDVPRGGNVDLILPVDDGVFDGSLRSDGLAIVCRPQLYVDLKRRGGPASEAAEFLRDRGALWPN